MNILLISASAPPMNSPESIQVGRYLKHLAPTHKITLVTSRISGGWEPADKKVEVFLENVSRIIRLRTLHPKIIAILKRVWPELLFPDEAASFTWQTNTVLRKMAVQPDVIFSRAAPFSSSLLAYRIANRLNKPWVMHLSDPWADSPYLQVSPKKQKKLLAIEQQCIQRASAVTLTSHQTVTFYQQKYPDMASKFKFLPNVFDDDDVNKTPLDFTGKIRFVFTGRLYGNRSVIPWLEAIERAARLNPQVELVAEFLFAGFFVDENIERLRNTSLSNIKYLGPLSLQEATHLQQNATVLVAIDALEESDSRYNLFFPSKLLDYLAAGRKILALTAQESTTHEVIDQKFGWCFSQNNMHQLPTFINYIIERFRQKDVDFFETKFDFAMYSARPNTERLNQILIDAMHGK